MSTFIISTILIIITGAIIRNKIRKPKSCDCGSGCGGCKGCH